MAKAALFKSADDFKHPTDCEMNNDSKGLLRQAGKYREMFRYFLRVQFKPVYLFVGWRGQSNQKTHHMHLQITKKFVQEHA